MQRFGLALGFLILTICTAAARPGSVALQYTHVGQFKVYAVTVNLNDPDVKVTPVLSRWGIGSSESFASMVHRTEPTAAITGTFFSPDNHLPTGDIVMNSRFVYFGGIGHGIAITPDNRAIILARPANRHVDWSGYETVLCGGPRLIWNGTVYANPSEEGFRDQHMMYSRTLRLGVGITRFNRLMLVEVQSPCYLSELGRVMRHLGCWNAINLDQGSSSAFYCRGRVVTRPSRSLTNLLAVYDRRDKYTERLFQIVPWRVASR